MSCINPPSSPPKPNNVFRRPEGTDDANWGYIEIRGSPFPLKARVSLARAAYSDSQVVLLDDPLSAVDAYVGKSILDNCLLSGPLANRTRILVTHALHVLDKTDYIYVVDHGVIIEQGTYEVCLTSALL